MVGDVDLQLAGLMHLRLDHGVHDLLRESLDKVKLIQDRLLMAQSRQKSYADRKIRDLEFMVGERVL